MAKSSLKKKRRTVFFFHLTQELLDMVDRGKCAYVLVPYYNYYTEQDELAPIVAVDLRKVADS